MLLKRRKQLQSAPHTSVSSLHNSVSAVSLQYSNQGWMQALFPALSIKLITNLLLSCVCLESFSSVNQWENTVLWWRLHSIKTISMLACSILPLFLNFYFLFYKEIILLYVISTLLSKWLLLIYFFKTRKLITQYVGSDDDYV